MNMRQKIYDAVSAWFDERRATGQAVPPPLYAEEIAVVAWKAYPDDFGLAGYQDQHPDFHKVYAAMCGDRGMVARGYFVDGGSLRGRRTFRPGRKPAQRTPAEITESHRKRGRRGGRPRNSTSLKVHLTRAERDLGKYCERLLSSKAADRARNGVSYTLTVVDAMEFFGASRVSELTPEVALDAKTKILDAAATYLITERQGVFLLKLQDYLAKFCN